MSVTNACVCWDFTMPETVIGFDEIVETLQECCKKWHFQLEKGDETGYLHYQGRIHLLTKVRSAKSKVKFPQQCHWSPTVKENINNFDYVTKDRTRVEGPWSSTDSKFMAPPKLPAQLAYIKELRPMQQKILDSAKPPIRDFRSINFLVCPKGNSGKTTISLWVEANRLGRSIPFCNDYKDAMRMVMNLEEQWHSNLYIFDVPRGLEKKKLYQFFAAIESIKDGKAYDDRYRFKQIIFDSPIIWIFSNKIPDVDLLSRDRWIFWTPTENHDIKKVTLDEIKDIVNDPAHTSEFDLDKLDGLTKVKLNRAELSRSS